MRRARAVPARRRRRSRGAAAARSCGGAIAGTKQLKARAGALDFVDLLAAGARSGRDNADVRARVPATLHAASSSTSSRTPIRCRPRFCCSCSRPIPTRTTGAGRRRARQAVHRRRSQAGDLPLPRRRCRDLPGGDASSSRRAARRVLQLTTSFRSVPAIQRVRQRRVRADDDRRRARRCRPSTCALARSRAPPTAAAGRGGAAGAGAVRQPARKVVGQGDRGVAAGRRRRVYRLARATRAAGR